MRPEGGAAGHVLDGGVATLEEPLGQGGMGTVYRGRLRGHEAPVAVKVLRLESLDPAARSDLAARLADEAAAAARVVHPNLVRLLASGLCPEHGPYVVYELVEGGTLTERLTKGPLPWEEVEERLAPQLLGALGALHAAGVVHRDVKPDNVFVTRDGRYLLGDLGLAVFEGRSALTATGVVVGTPGYLAPERITRPELPPSPAADVYAAAMVLLRAGAGCLPFRSRDAASLVAEQVRRAMTPPELQRLGVPRPTALVLAPALDPDPDGRPPSAAALAQRLVGARARDEGSSSSATVTRAQAAPRRPRAPASAALPRPAPAAAASPPRRLLPGALVALVLACVLLLVPRTEAPPREAVPEAHGRDDLATLVLAARPLLPDAVVAGLLADPSLLRSVALGAGTASPAGVGARLLVEPGSPAVLAETALTYARLLPSVPPQAAATSTLLLVELLCRLPPPAPSLDDLSLASFAVLTHLPPSVREGARGRSLNLSLDLHLAAATSGGLPGAARRGLRLALADPELDGALPRLAGAAGLDLPSVADARAHRLLVEALADPARERVDDRIADLGLLHTYQLTTALGAGGDLLAGAAERLTSDWYDLLPSALVLPGAPPPARESRDLYELQTLASRLARRREMVARRGELTPLRSGPFAPVPLLGRLGFWGVVLAERAVAGDVNATVVLVRDLEEVVGLDAAPGPAFGRGGPFLDRMDALLASFPGGRTALATLRALRLLPRPGQAAEGRGLLADAADAALDAAEASLTQDDVETLISVLDRLRKVDRDPAGAGRREAAVERARALVARLQGPASPTGPVRASLTRLGEELAREP